MKSASISFLFSIIILTACTTGEPQEFEHTGYAQGSTYQIKYVHHKDMNLQEEIDQLFLDLDLSMSTWVDSSLISQVNNTHEWIEVDEYFDDVLQRSFEISEESDGGFDPTVAPLVRLWGFGFDKVRGDLSDEEIQETLEVVGMNHVLVDGNKVKLDEGSSLDFNAIAQGYTVDVMAAMLEDYGIKRYMIEVGGEVRARGFSGKNKTWVIGVDKPQANIDSQDRFQFILKLENAALATSGTYRKFWVDEESGIRYAHTIDPETGRPAMNKLLSASIIAPTGMDADGYATVCLVKGLEDCKTFLADKPELEGYLVYSNDDGTWGEYITEGFKKYIVE